MRLVCAALLVVAVSGCTRKPAEVYIEPQVVGRLENKGKTVPLKAQTRDEKGMFIEWVKPKWESSDPSVAKVGDDGTLEAVGSGKTTISATHEGVTGKIPVEARILGPIEFEPKGPIKMKLFKEMKFKTIVKDDRGNVITDLKPRLKRSGQEVDIVDDNTLYAGAEGPCTITAIVGAATGQLQIEVVQ